MDRVLDQLAAAGLEVSGSLEFGKLIRCRADGDKGRKQSGWYVAHELRLDSGETAIVGRFGNWKRYGNESMKLEFNHPRLTADDRQRLERDQQALREQAAAEKRQRAEEAASRAHRMWSRLPEGGKSGYLTRKKIAAFGVRFCRGRVVVPVCNGSGLVGLQFISDDGEKKFLTGTPKQGAWHLIGSVSPDTEGRLWIAEGYATGATVHQAMGEPVAVAFDAGNLFAVGRALRAIFPLVQLVFAADNDASTEGNPGLTKAREAAAALHGLVVVPSFERLAA